MARKSIIIDGMDGKELIFTESADKLSMTIRVNDPEVEQTLAEVTINAEGFDGIKDLCNSYGDNRLKIEYPAVENPESLIKEEDRIEADLGKLANVIPHGDIENINGTRPYQVRKVNKAEAKAKTPGLTDSIPEEEI